MKKLLICLLVVCACILVSGCMETLTMVKVKKDGTGTIMLRVYMSEKALKEAAKSMGNAMAGAMGNAMGEMMGTDGEMTVTESPATVTTEQDKPLYDENQMKSFAKMFGEGVEFVKGEEKTRKDGWKGFVVYYKFKDVTKIGVAPGIGEMLMTMGQMGAMIQQADLSLKDQGYSFNFKPGTESMITINPPPEPEKPEMGDSSSPGMGAPGMGMPPGMGGQGMGEGDMPPEMAKMQEQMMKQMMEAMKGKRDVIMVAVDGEISSTNAKYRSKKYPNMMTLFSMDMGKMMENSKDPNSLQDLNVDSMKELAKMNIPGLMMEDPTKKITVKFK